MKFLIIASEYVQFREWFYAQHPGLQRRSYAEQMAERRAGFYDMPASYADGLRKLGHEVELIVFNSEYIQKAWAREHGLRLAFDRSLHFRWRRRVVPWLSLVEGQKWVYDILAAQIKQSRPDVLWAWVPLTAIDPVFLGEMRPYTRFLVGAMDSSPVPDRDYRCYDLVLTSLPPFVDMFRAQGLRAELFFYGFDPRILDQLGSVQQDIPISFIGSFFKVHEGRIRLVETLCREFDIQVWSTSIHRLAADSPIRRAYRGRAWGIEMFNILARSQITLNEHGGIDTHVCNMRLYEATGAGALLLNDWKPNLPELFEPGREVAAYRSIEDCAAQIRHYLDHPDERRAIAAAGQQRTLTQYNTDQRAAEIEAIIRRTMGAG